MDESTEPVKASGGARFLRVLGGFVVAGFVLAVIIGLASLLWLLSGATSGLGRFVVAVFMSLGIAWFGVGYFRQLGNPPPPDPEPIAVDPKLRLAYICEMCGMELAVLMAAKEKAPKHCGEPMVLVRKSLPHATEESF